MAKRAAPEVNAGSMADIAFLLLIFFLVTTTIETDSGINRKLPPMEDSDEDVIIKQKNIFTVLLNGKDQLLVEDNIMELKDLREAAREFLDNGGDGSCNYCQGKYNQFHMKWSRFELTPLERRRIDKEMDKAFLFPFLSSLLAT